MAKQISQETFDAAVRENMEEFDMDIEEAIEDAVSQFEAQGINLSNVVRDARVKYDESGTVHPVVSAVKSLAQTLQTDPVDCAAVRAQCQQIKAECDIDLAHRCLAGRHDAYETLLKALDATDGGDTRRAILNALCSLCNGQPDLLDESGRRKILDLVRTTDDPELVLLLVKFIRYTCIKHEQNRRSYVADDLIQILSDLLDKSKTDSGIVKEVCAAFRVLTFDDDIRVPFASAHDHAKLIVTKAGALKRILEMCKDYINDRAVLGELFATLACLAVRNEFCQEILDLGGLQLILETMEKNMEHPGITKQVLTVLKAIAGNDAVKVATVKHGAAELILTALTRHVKHPAICEMGCAALGAIVLRNPNHSKQFMDAGAATVLVKVLQLHTDHANVQKQACVAIRNLVARNREYCELFLDQDVEELIQNVYQTHKSCHDEAKGALRDLGCKVELKELWKGMGQQLER